MALTKITPQMFDPSAAGHNFNVDNGTFFIDASANQVGIGTTTPSTLLDVNGALTATTIAGTLTTAAQTNITSVGTLTGLTVGGTISIGDWTNAINIGASNDLQLYHVGGNSHIKSDTGQLIIRTDALRVLNNANSEQILHGDADGAVTLYYDNAAKLATTSGGVTVTGALTATTFTDGYVTWNVAQFNRYGAAIEFQFTPTNTATLVKIGANGSNPTIFNAYSGDASFSGTVRIPDGSNAAPALTFSNDTDTGIIRVTTNALGITAAGSRKFYVNATNAYYQNLSMVQIDAGNFLLNDSGATERSIRIQNSQATGYFGVEGSSANRFVGSAANNMFLGTTTADGIEFATNNNVRAVITSSGNVGIGTASPGKRLHIFDATQTNQSVYFGNPAAAPYGEINYNSTGMEHLYIDSHGTTTGYGNIVFRTGPTPETRMFIHADGKVGIGISSGLDRDLHIKGSGSDVGIQIEKTGAHELRVAIDSTGPYLFAEGTAPLRFYQNNAEIVRISGGNVGIGTGTTAPAGQLHVRTQASATPTIKVTRGLDGGRIQLQYAANTSGFGEIGQIYHGTGRTKIWIGANLNSFSTGHNSITQHDTGYAAWAFVSDSYSDEANIQRLTTAGAHKTLIVKSTGVIVNEVKVNTSIHHFEISKAFTATGSSVTRHEINLINEIGATTAGNLRYEVMCQGYASGGANGINAKYSVAGYSGHNYSSTNHGSLGAGTIQNGYKSSNSTSYDAKGLSYHPCVNMGSYIANGEIYAYVPGPQRYGFTISNNHSTGISIVVTIKGFYK